MGRRKKINLRPAMVYAAKKIRARLRFQIPRDTGALRRSLHVITNKKGEIEISYHEYGMFTNLGTGKYRISKATNFKGYKKGTGGIRAQQWSAIPERDLEDIRNNLSKEISKAIDKIKDPLDLVEVDYRLWG